MEIKLIKNYNIVKYHSIQHEIGEIECRAWIPGYQIFGYKRHWLTISKTLNFEFTESSFEIFNKSLYLPDLNKKFLDLIGSFMNLNLHRDEDVYNYKTLLNELSFSLSFSYYFSRKENIKLFLLHTNFTGEERTFEKDTIFFGCICQVEFDHEEFMRLYKGQG